MQSRDGLTDNITPNIQIAIPLKIYRHHIQQAASAGVAAAGSSGSRHITLGRFGRGLMFFVLIAGRLLRARAARPPVWPAVSDPPSMLHFDLISIL